MVFLPESTRHHDMLSAQPPVIRGAEPEFLIEASSAYPALEKRTLDARARIWFAYRVFDPKTPLYHPETKALGLSTWADLLAYKLDRGVSFRLLLTDFDPVVGDTLHENTWRALKSLYDRKAAATAPWDMQICPALHDARTGRYVRLMLAPAIYARINSKRNDLNAMPAHDRADMFQYMRGYHRYLRLARSGKVQWRPKLVLPRIFPVTHHHKLAVFDDTTTIFGGLDVNERRYDSPAHDRPSVETWHDVSLEVTGKAATQVGQYIADIWNKDRDFANQRMILAREQCPRLFGTLDPPLDPLEAPSTVGVEDTGPVPMQIIRTASRNRGTFRFHLRPKTIDHGIEDAHFALIREAETFLYIETQFFRHKPLAEALAERARECPSLRLVMLLPAAPEEVAFDDKNGLDSRYGERLQADCIRIVSEAYGQRVLFVCPAQKIHAKGEGRNITHNAPIIYVHAKIAVADDAWAIIGSANLNGRSLKWDSELGLLWNSDSAGTLRRRLTSDWIDGRGAETPMADAFDLWRDVAVSNARMPATQRRGFIVPYLSDNADAMGVSVPMLPPEIV